MGKSKTTKFRRPQFNSVGLPMNAVKEVDVEEEALGDDSCPAAEFLEKVRHFVSIRTLIVTNILFVIYLRIELKLLTGNKTGSAFPVA